MKNYLLLLVLTIFLTVSCKDNSVKSEEAPMVDDTMVTSEASDSMAETERDTLNTNSVEDAVNDVSPEQVP